MMHTRAPRVRVAGAACVLSRGAVSRTTGAQPERHFASGSRGGSRMASRRLQHVRSALHSSWAPAAAGDSGLPIVAIIDMENKDGTIYSGAGDDTIELDELRGTAKVSHAPPNCCLLLAAPHLLRRTPTAAACCRCC
jgi:hypothetical protein